MPYVVKTIVFGLSDVSQLHISALPMLVGVVVVLLLALGVLISRGRRR